MLLVGGAGLLISTKYDDFGIFLCLNTIKTIRQSWQFFESRKRNA